MSAAGAQWDPRAVGMGQDAVRPVGVPMVVPAVVPVPWRQGGCDGNGVRDSGNTHKCSGNKQKKLKVCELGCNEPGL